MWFVVALDLFWFLQFLINSSHQIYEVDVTDRELHWTTAFETPCIVFESIFPALPPQVSCSKDEREGFKKSRVCEHKRLHGCDRLMNHVIGAGWVQTRVGRWGVFGSQQAGRCQPLPTHPTTIHYHVVKKKIHSTVHNHPVTSHQKETTQQSTNILSKITRIARAALHKLARKSSLNVSFVFPVCPAHDHPHHSGAGIK